MGSSAVDPVVTARHVPPATILYWLCQAAGWGGFLTYVLGGYLVFSPVYEIWPIASIVFFCIVPPILLTHALRAWMYAHGWWALPEWPRKGRQLAVALGFAIAVSVAVRVANDVPEGHLFELTASFWWMLLAYCLAFWGWVGAYNTAHAYRRRLELESVGRDAQLRALRAQLNPHFLFNSLNSVRSLIAENPQRAAEMVTGLSEILRYALASNRTDTVPLADELRVIEEYLHVERVRFEERLRVELAVDPRALAVPVPPMIVQTLVENAVKHGISASPTGGLVRIDARIDDGRLDVVVSNTGRFKPPGGGGYGLQNATERLRLQYGGRGSLTMEEDGDRTVASLRLPCDSAAGS